MKNGAPLAEVEGLLRSAKSLLERLLSRGKCMFKWNFKKNIRYKLLRDIFIVLFLSTCVLSATIAITVGAALEKALMSKASSFASEIARHNEKLLGMQGSSRLDVVSTEPITDEEIIYAVITDSSGKILTTKRESINLNWQGIKSFLPMTATESDLVAIIESINKQAVAREVTVPIMRGTDVLGSVTVGMSKHAITEQITRTILLVILLSILAGCAVGITLYITTGKTLRDPIIELGQAAARLAKGEIYTSVRAATTGEMQMLVDSFNQMAEDLEKTTVSKYYVDSIINSMVDTLFVISSDGTITLANQTACRQLGYDQKDLIGRPFDLILGRPAAVKSSIEDIFRGKLINNIEIEYITKQGEKVPMLFSGSLISFSGGILLGAVCAATNITALKKTEEALRDANDRLHATLQASPAAIITLSPKGIVTMWNETAERIFGWSKDEIIGRFYSLLQDSDREEFQLLRNRLLSGESLFDEEVILKRKNGAAVHISVSASPLHDAQGQISSIMAVMTDITDRKKMEAELQKSQNLESIGILAGGIAHDFNNILTSIMGNISMVKLSLGQDHESYAKLAMAEHATLRAKDLTHQLLTFSRGGAPIKKTTTFSEIIRESAIFSLRGSNVKCELNLADDLWPIEVDEGQVSQVVHNLVLNADQAMPDGGIIRVCANNAVLSEKDGVPLPEGNYLKITVEDQGAGISTEQLKRIFDPYFTTKQGGTGLGLAIAYSIIKKHDGYIMVKSVRGTGTVFTVFLPASTKRIPPEKPAADAPVYGNGKILIMDDDAMLRDVAGAMLDTLGYEAGYARDGREAIELYVQARATSRPFDAIIMDLTIPGGMGGKEAIKELLKTDPHVKAIVSSGYSQDSIMANYRESGFSAIISKPYKLTDLSETLHAVLKGGQPDSVS